MLIKVYIFQTRTQADMVFDLSRFLDFSLKFLDTDLEGTCLVTSSSSDLLSLTFGHVFICFVLFSSPDDPVDDGNGVYHVSLKSQQVLECALEFQPSEVQSETTYNYNIASKFV